MNSFIEAYNLTRKSGTKTNSFSLKKIIACAFEYIKAKSMSTNLAIYCNRKLV